MLILVVMVVMALGLMLFTDSIFGTDHAFSDDGCGFGGRILRWYYSNSVPTGVSARRYERPINVIFMLVGIMLILSPSYVETNLFVPRGHYATITYYGTIVAVAESGEKTVRVSAFNRLRTFVRPIPLTWERTVRPRDDARRITYVLKGTPREGIAIGNLLAVGPELLQKESAERHFEKFMKHGEVVVGISELAVPAKQISNQKGGVAGTVVGWFIAGPVGAVAGASYGGTNEIGPVYRLTRSYSIVWGVNSSSQ